MNITFSGSSDESSESHYDDQTYMHKSPPSNLGRNIKINTTSQSEVIQGNLVSEIWKIA
jgi:hypothetical protein